MLHTALVNKPGLAGLALIVQDVSVEEKRLAVAKLTGSPATPDVGPRTMAAGSSTVKTADPKSLVGVPVK
jgi:hypothetical protein